jgi:lipocalin
MIVASLSLIFSLTSVNSQTVKYLNVSAYYGHWTQIYDDYAVRASFEHNISCDCAYYYPNPNQTIGVVNSGNRGNASGHPDIVRGWANIPNMSEPGKLLVHLQPTGGFGAPYWVYKLGPIENDQYQYSIVSDDIKLLLFVLARNYTEFFVKYNQEVLVWLFRNGFVGTFNHPIPTDQNGCIYSYTK